MLLSDLLAYDNIVVQCHDDPDADALGSGFAIYTYLKTKGKDVALVYAGKNRIKKSNLINMVEDLQIPILHVQTISDCDLLVTVDCQYGQGNVTKFDAPAIAVIDHHMVAGTLPDLNEVRSNLGSCSTLVWNMLKEEGFDTNQNIRLSTALYYGLYMDTGGMAEVHHPMDFDLRETAAVDQQMINHFLNSNLSIEELEVAGTALLRMDLMEEYRCALVKANPCDPNILGIISDLVLQVDTVDVCMVFCKQPTGVKYSVRSCVREVHADEMAIYIAEGIGTGGGHTQKAGGFIELNLLIPAYLEYCNKLQIKPRINRLDDETPDAPSSSGVKAFLESRLRDYFENSFVIDAKHFNRKTMDFKEYVRRRVPYGYLVASDIYPVGSSFTVRSMYGDIPVTVQENMVFLVGNRGDFFATSKQALEQNYRLTDWRFNLSRAEYIPTVHLTEEKQMSSIAPHLKVCIPCDSSKIQAVKLDRNVKLFELWDDKTYKYGKKGDYLVVKSEMDDDIALVRGDVFESRFKALDEFATMPTRAVIFDMDGTVLDTLEDLADATNYALDSVGEKPVSIKAVKGFVGNGFNALLARALPGGFEDPRLPEAKEAFRDFYFEHATDKTKPYPGVLQLMQELKYNGIQIGIVSNKIDEAVKNLSALYFPELISDAVGESENVRKKPAPDGVLQALSTMGIKPEEAIYVGDSEVDIETANNAGMRCVSVSWGFKDEHFLREHGATTIISSPLDLLRYI